jgi:hypothetical protein
MITAIDVVKNQAKDQSGYQIDLQVNTKLRYKIQQKLSHVRSTVWDHLLDKIWMEIIYFKPIVPLQSIPISINKTLG